MTDKPFDPPGPNWLWRWIWKIFKRKGDKLLGVDQPKELPSVNLDGPESEKPKFLRRR